ncbi:hypothetical protein [Azospirillum picis]|uniref:Uncharacterized protein n=1 Tax=Azospirillum picis TaxID=488438 RepID=A0ABU0MUM7_9PROT|nr:hypothetical protein [Azospirillum picis]MBP2303295.1 hypothetical protein [Azospirillum picis]MDQ0537165.1 hypothetical protein [Azospirillum picis]
MTAATLETRLAALEIDAAVVASQDEYDSACVLAVELSAGHRYIMQPMEAGMQIARWA